MSDRFKFRVWNDMQKCYSADDHYISEDGFINTIGDYVLEQCTGLKDKHGKLIYDNDLIKINDELYRVAVDDFDCRTVILDNNPFTEVVEWSDIVKKYYFYNRVDEIEVVGNIRENKDLLGEQSDE